MENKTMTEQARELRRFYMRRWRQNHPEKDREYHIKYWNKKAAALTEEDREAMKGAEIEAMRESGAGFDLEMPDFTPPDFSFDFEI